MSRFKPTDRVVIVYGRDAWKFADSAPLADLPNAVVREFGQKGKHGSVIRLATAEDEAEQARRDEEKAAREALRSQRAKQVKWALAVLPSAWVEDNDGETVTLCLPVERDKLAELCRYLAVHPDAQKARE